MKTSLQSSLGALLIACLLGVALSRAPWMDRDIWNLDEGSTFTMAHQVMEGDVLYRDAADNRSPLVPYLKAAIFAIAGDWNASAVHIALTLLIGLTVFALAWIALQLGGWRMAWPTAIAAWFLQIYWIDIGDAMSANTEWFVIAFSTAAFALFVASRDRFSPGRGLGVGLLFGGAVLCKQPGLLDMLVAAILLGLLALQAESATRRSLLGFGVAMVVGTVLPLGLFSAHYWLAGAWDDYVYYAFTFNTEVYIPEIPFWERMASIRKPFVMAYHNAPLLGGLGILAGIALLRAALPQLKPTRRITLLPWLILGWTASGLVSTTLSGRDFSHYSEQVIPGLSLAIGWWFSRLQHRDAETSSRWRPWAVRFIISALVISVGVRIIQIRRDIAAIDAQPHPLGVLARQFSDPSEHLFVWGYFPEIYFTAQRSPATRFIYTNYLTGMIAWTNLDPFIDVTYGISPGAQEKFEADFESQPPAVIVDTNDLRGYARFPIESRAWLWPRIQAQYAQVAVFSREQHRMRLFRILDEDVADLPPSALHPEAVPPELAIAGVADLRPGSVPMVEAQGATGFSRFHLMQAETPIASVRYQPDLPAHVRFFLNDLVAHSNTVWILAERPDGTWARSETFDIAAFTAKHRANRQTHPVMRFEETIIPPSSVASQYHEITPYDGEGELWSILAPGYLRYPCPAGVGQVRFVHGMSLSAMFASDGYDIALYWIESNGNENLLWRRRIEPHRRGEDQYPQPETVDLPPRPPGELEVRFTAGPYSNALNDQVFFGHLVGFTQQPALYVGEKAIFATAAPDTQFAAADAGFWLMHAPASMSWPRDPYLMEFSFDYGVESGAYDNPDNSHSDGVGFQLALTNTTGNATVLWEDTLRPFNHEEDRGLHHATVVLPRSGAGRIILSTHAGDHNDTSWDWGFAGNFRAAPPGPPIHLDDGRTLYSIAAAGYDQGWSDRQDATHWGAQSPQELTYPKPIQMESLTLRYGINPAAGRDETGGQRSDGVHTRVLFESDSGEIIELFEHFLDPFNRPDDAREHVAQIPTLPGHSGKLRIRMEPGPHENNSFDWAYWGVFEGQLSR